MRSLSILAFVLFSTLYCLAYEGPAIAETGATTTYPGKFDSIKQVNFKECLILLEGRPIKLHHGAFKSFKHGEGGVDVELVNSWVVPSKPGGPQLVLLFFVRTLIGGSSARTGFVQLLAIEKSRLVIKQEYRFIPLDIPQVCEFDPQNGELTIVAKSDDPSPIFAPAFADHAFYRLNGNKFEQTSWQTVSTKLPQAP